MKGKKQENRMKNQLTISKRNELDKIETRLCIEYDQMRENILNQIHQSDDPELLAMANHIADGCDWTEAAMMNETDIALLRHKANQLRDIKIALERIKIGTYGICLHCGEPIPAARMQAQITSEYCVACQEQLEKHQSIKSH